MGRALVVLLHWYVFFLTILYINCHVCPNFLCREKEKEALLTFKQHVKDPSNRLSSWTGNKCCTWRGISCDNKTGHVIKLNLTNPCNPYDMCDYFALFLSGSINDFLKELSHLQYLDLSLNDFEPSHIPSVLGSLQKLKYLNLSQAGFDMKVDSLKWLSNLSSLEVLDMSGINLSKISNSFPITFGSLSTLALSFTFVSVQVVFNVPTLRNLYLRDNSFDKIPNWLYNITSLEKLDLSLNKISLVFLSDFHHLSHLKYLHLSFNEVKGELYELLGNSSVCGVKNLEHLYLNGNYIFGALPNHLGRLSKLSILSLDENLFSGIIPMSISKLSSLKLLNIANNQLTGKIPTSIKNLSSLRVLDVSGNKLTGKIPTSIENLSSLRVLDVSRNKLTGEIPRSIGNLSSLKVLNVFDNLLSEAIPTNLGNLWNLEYLNIGQNNLEGFVSELHFSNLTRLKVLYTFSNQLKLIVPSNWIPPFQLHFLSFSSMQVGPQFPSWIESQNDLQYLDLSSSGISDIIPSWFWSRCPQINFLDLSQNQIHGSIPNLSCNGVFLNSNNFSGPLPHLSPTVQRLDLSNNSFHDSPSLVLCKPNNRLYGLEILDLSKNLLYGQLPHCLVNYSDLRVLHLGDNSLTGNISSSLGIPFQLESLSLHNNNLFGNFPRFLWNCSWLFLLDLSENNLSGNISIRLENSSPLLQLRFIVLHSNKFGGSIPKKLCRFHFLQILDLAKNNFTGSIPRCFGNFSGMMWERNFNYTTYLFGRPKLYLITKRQKYEYSKSLMEITTMDLSSNSLTGVIPGELTNLYWLRFLNLSNNHLYGNIPRIFNGMKQLESLDLSWNQLTGVIPQSLANLSFLSILNLSYNDLSGRIPISTQLQSFSKFDFIGNDDLCGPPLTTTCPGDNTFLEPVPSFDDGGGKNGGWMDKRWFYMGLPFGFAVGFWVILGPLAFNKAWRYRYYKFWDDVRYRLFGGI